MTHEHHVDPWPFADELNTAAFICSHVLENDRPVHHVVHDSDGAWQFLCGDDHEYEDARIVCLACIVSRDLQGLPELADLPLGCWHRHWSKPPRRRSIEPRHQIASPGAMQTSRRPSRLTWTPAHRHKVA
jgi:hypothetical protein